MERVAQEWVARYGATRCSEPPPPPSDEARAPHAASGAAAAAAAPVPPAAPWSVELARRMAALPHGAAQQVRARVRMHACVCVCMRAHGHPPALAPARANLSQALARLVHPPFAWQARQKGPSNLGPLHSPSGAPSLGPAHSAPPAADQQDAGPAPPSGLQRQSVSGVYLARSYMGGALARCARGSACVHGRACACGVALAPLAVVEWLPTLQRAARPLPLSPP